MDKVEVGRRIKDFIKEKCMTQEELAKELGLKQSSISDMISGRRDTIRLAIDISEKYNIDRNILLGDNSNTNDIDQSEITKRINELITDSGLKVSQFAIKAGIDPSGFKKKTKGLIPWTVNDINKFNINLRIRKGWLIDGEGQKFQAPDEMLNTIPATSKQNDDIIKNAADLFTDQALRVEKFIVMLSDEISEVRSIKEELQKQREENARLQEMLHDAIFALRTAEQRGPARMSIAAEDRQ